MSADSDSNRTNTFFVYFFASEAPHSCRHVFTLEHFEFQRFSNRSELVSSLRLKLGVFAPISFPLPSGQMAHRMISVTEATATILSLSPSEPAITLALSATLSITQSRRGEVKTCCHPVDSFTLREGERETERERERQRERGRGTQMIHYRKSVSLC